MRKTILFNLGLALEGVFSNKLRAILTALGIMFGVGAVIAMLAIGKGAKESILEQMSLIGTNNIVVKARMADEMDQETEEAQTGNGDEPGNYTPGLDMMDVRSILTNVPTVERVSPEIIFNSNFIYGGKSKKGKCIGVTNDFFHINNLQLEKGRLFTDYHNERGSAVCIIGKSVAQTFFSGEDPIGKSIKCGPNWLRIIGILAKRSGREENLEKLGIRDYNSDLYVPVQTALIRFENREKIEKDNLRDRRSDQTNYHQIDKMTINVVEARYLRHTATLISRILKRRHQQKLDFEVEVPELLLQQEQKTQETFNFVLAVIAGISLLVGGIGIMNIMLASVLERIKEIGIRRSLGATRRDIILQFLLEAIIISLFGGFVGIIIGIVASRVIAASAEIPTTIDIWALALSFLVAVSVGLIFGILPARKAAMQDPIKALRTE